MTIELNHLMSHLMRHFVALKKIDQIIHALTLFLLVAIGLND